MSGQPPLPQNGENPEAPMPPEGEHLAAYEQDNSGNSVQYQEFTYQDAGEVSQAQQFTYENPQAGYVASTEQTQVQYGGDPYASAPMPPQYQEGANYQDAAYYQDPTAQAQQAPYPGAYQNAPAPNALQAPQPVAYQNVQQTQWSGQGFAPVRQLDTNRSLVKFIFLGIITLGIYSVWVVARSGEDLNTIASPRDGQRTMNYWLVFFLLSPITLGIMNYVWLTIASNRIGATQEARGFQKTVDGATFWLWGVLGSLIIVGPFIFWHKWLEAMNEICESYNVNG